VVICIEDKWAQRIADGIAATGKPVATFSIEGRGDFETVRQASWKAKELVQWASELRREPVELGELVVSIKCGESDTTTGLGSCPTVGVVVDDLVDAGATVYFGETPELTGGEHLIADRCASAARELGREPGLADAGLSGDEDGGAAPRPCRVERAPELLELARVRRTPPFSQYPASRHRAPGRYARRRRQIRLCARCAPARSGPRSRRHDEHVEARDDGGGAADDRFDVAAIIDQLRLDRPVLVGWSYGAFIICDYVRAHGQDRIAAIQFVEGAVKLGDAAFGTLIGPGFLDHFAHATADDLPTNIWAMRSFVRASLAKPLGADEFETALCWNIVVRRGSAPTSRRARSTTTTCCAPSRCRCSHARPGGLGRAAGDGRARPRHLRGCRGLLVRRRRSRAAPGGARALQPRARRADHSRPGLMPRARTRPPPPAPTGQRGPAARRRRNAA
jgi:pimeloyl-ACP methyl ester carboxylesterase